MKGVSMPEFIELLSHGHEAEFTYDGTAFVIQPEISEGKTFLVIWDCSPEGKRISRFIIPEKGDIPVEAINRVLNDKCFSGKSFMEIERDITVDTIF